MILAAKERREHKGDFARAGLGIFALFAFLCGNAAGKGGGR